MTTTKEKERAKEKESKETTKEKEKDTTKKEKDTTKDGIHGVKEDTTTTATKDKEEERKRRKDEYYYAVPYLQKFGHVAANCWYKDSTYTTAGVGSGTTVTGRLSFHVRFYITAGHTTRRRTVESTGCLHVHYPEGWRGGTTTLPWQALLRGGTSTTTRP